MSGPLTAYLAGGINDGYRARPRAIRAQGHQSEAQLPLLSIDEGEIVDATPLIHATSTEHQIESEDDRQRVRSYFSYEDDHLRLKDSRIKADSKREYVARLTSLFVYAHELEGRPKVPRAAVNTLLTEAALYDGNARSWLANTTDLMSNGDLVELTVPGRERAVETLKRNSDPNVIGGYVLGTSSRTRIGKQGASKNNDEADSGSKKVRRQSNLESKKIAPWVEEWKKAGISLDAYEILTGRSTADKAMFGLWAIRKARGEAGRVVSRVQLVQFLYQAFEIKIDDRYAATVLQKPAMKDRVIRVEGTRFQITPEGMAYVDRMIEGKTPSTKATKGSGGSGADAP